MYPEGRVDPQVANLGFVSVAVILYVLAALVIIAGIIYMRRHWNQNYDAGVPRVRKDKY